MKIIISPAKKMETEDFGIAPSSVPLYNQRAARLKERLGQLSLKELKELLGCSEKLAQLNYRRYQEMRDFTGEDTLALLTPALLAYEGIQYQYMAPKVFSHAQWEYTQEHLRILSGFYGCLRPLDGVVSYRLEMQAKLQGEWGKDLYEFWGDAIYAGLMEKDVIVNLASEEYAKAIRAHLDGKTPMISCIFGEKIEGKIKVKGTIAKMARGSMVRYMAEKQIEDVEELKKFQELGFCFSQQDSDRLNFVFLREKRE